MTDCEMVALFLHALEHESTGAGRVIDAAKARATPCKCFEHEGAQYAWSPGVLGLISERKNPEQFAEFCALGCEPAGEGVKERFERVRGAARKAAEKYKGGGLPEWWTGVGEAMEEAGVEL